MWTPILTMSLGLALADDGAPLNGLALADVAKNLPACQTTAPSAATLDLNRGCIGDACTGLEKEALDVALDEVGECTPSRSTTGLTHCKWADGDISAQFRDTKGPGATSLFVKSDQWRNADGLGVGSQLTCFLDRFADSAVGVKVDVEDGWLIWHSVQFREPRIIVTVSEDATIEKLQLSGNR